MYTFRNCLSLRSTWIHLRGWCCSFLCSGLYIFCCNFSFRSLHCLFVVGVRLLVTLLVSSTFLTFILWLHNHFITQRSVVTSTSRQIRCWIVFVVNCQINKCEQFTKKMILNKFQINTNYMRFLMNCMIEDYNIQSLSRMWYGQFQRMRHIFPSENRYAEFMMKQNWTQVWNCLISHYCPSLVILFTL